MRVCACVCGVREGGEGPLALPASAGRARWRLSAWPLCERRRRRAHARVKGTSCHRRPRAVPGRLVLVPAVLAAWAAVSPSREAAAESRRPSAEGARSACYSSCCHWRLLSRSNTVDISVGGRKLPALECWLHVRPRARGRRATESRVDVALAHPNTEHSLRSHSLTPGLSTSVVGGGIGPRPRPAAGAACPQLQRVRAHSAEGCSCSPQGTQNLSKYVIDVSCLSA